MKTFLIIGHPGHELVISHWISINKPYVFILTDGSGSLEKGRIITSKNLLSKLGAKYVEVKQVFKDKQLYQDIIIQNPLRCLEWIDMIYKEILISEERSIRIVGDNIEGFSTTHDLTRYMINMLAFKLRRSGREVENYAVNLYDLVGKKTISESSKDIILKLSKNELATKIALARDYPEIKEDLDILLSKHGETTFQEERLLYNSPDKEIISSPEYPAHYEVFGEKRVKEGKYQHSITFKRELKPFTQQLMRLFLEDQT